MIWTFWAMAAAIYRAGGGLWWGNTPKDSDFAGADGGNLSTTPDTLKYNPQIDINTRILTLFLDRLRPSMARPLAPRSLRLALAASPLPPVR